MTTFPEPKFAVTQKVYIKKLKAHGIIDARAIQRNHPVQYLVVIAGIRGEHWYEETELEEVTR